MKVTMTRARRPPEAQGSDGGKKPGMDVMIAVAPHRPKPSNGEDLSEPDGMGDDGEQASSSDGLSSLEEEKGESPAQEGAEELGGKLIQDILSAGEGYGLSPEDSKSFAADLFDALAECLRSGNSDEAGQGGGYRVPNPASQGAGGNRGEFLG